MPSRVLRGIHTLVYHVLRFAQKTTLCKAIQHVCQARKKNRTRDTTMGRVGCSTTDDKEKGDRKENGNKETPYDAVEQTSSTGCM